MTIATLIIVCTLIGLAALAIGVIAGSRYASGSTARLGRGQRTPELEAVETALDRLARRVDEAESVRRADQAGMRAELAEQVRHVQAATDVVRREAGQLASALGRVDMRGRWGEAHLRRLVEAAGMLERVHFWEQDQRATDDGIQRPDMVIDLAAGRRIVVDAKVPLAALLEAEACDDPGAQAEHFARHARDVAAHADRLGAKDYWRQYADSVDAVVMFLPAESMLGIALREDPTLLDRAFGRNVILATPTTLLALLRTVGHVWRQEEIADNAREIHRLGRELHERLGVYADHMRRMGASLDAAVGHYNKMVGSFDGRVMVTSRRLADHGLGDGPIAEPSPITQRAREVGTAEQAGMTAVGAALS